MPLPTRDRLALAVCQDEYRPVESQCYCEVAVDDEFHQGRILSKDYDNRQMWKLPDSRLQGLRRIIGDGGAFICDECYHTLPKSRSEMPQYPKTRKSMGLGSKPPRVRRMPL